MYVRIDWVKPVSENIVIIGDSYRLFRPRLNQVIEGKVDLGAIATEFLLLGIDPYPRKAGAEFAAVKTADDSARPFAALEALKKRLGG